MQRIIFFTLGLIFCFRSYIVPQTNFDHSIFDNLLKKYVNRTGMVNYGAFNNNKDFNDYLVTLNDAEIDNLSNNDKLAFYINAYNAIVIKNVSDHWPINSPLEVDGFFNKIKHKIAGMDMTLDELEHKYTLTIEPVLSHFGLVCAAKSCPKLIQRAYYGKDVITQLNDNAIFYMNDVKNNRLDSQNSVLYLSEIFKWFPEAFEEKYGSLKNTAIYFMNHEDKQFLKENEVEIKFVKYNWELNAQ